MEANGTVVILLVMLVLSLVVIYVLRAKNIKLTERFAGVASIDSELLKLQNQKAVLEQDVKKDLADAEQKVVHLKLHYQEKKAIYDRLLGQVALYDEQVKYGELGLYQPHFDFDTSEQYKTSIEKVRNLQKAMLSNKKAVICTEGWTVNGSASKGQTAVNRLIRLTTRAFNGECDAAIANVRWNNVERMEQRIIKACETMNGLNVHPNVNITDGYLQLKLQELRLVYEHEEKRHSEREEQAELRRQLREEEQLKRDIEKAVKEEERYQKLLEKAEKEAEKATGDRLVALQSVIDGLTVDLREAHSRAERAMSMAQQTRAGHVYVISNVGAFGEGVYKIGMTRRLDPTERVKELGDASVPFPFDTHALIYTEDAPSLENALHKALDKSKMNLVNARREFFRADLSEIIEVIKQKMPDAEVFAVPEAREYTESNTIRQRATDLVEAQKALPVFPDEI